MAGMTGAVPEAILVGGLTGSAGIAFAFAFASFIGFEATAIYGEESKDPKKVVPRATYWAVGIITGWVLVLLPFVLWVAGWTFSRVGTNVHTTLLKDIVS
jgi:amino acid transporter